jgi:hypothetical protein
LRWRLGQDGHSSQPGEEEKEKEADRVIHPARRRR